MSFVAVGLSTLRAGSTADVPVCIKLSLVLDQHPGEVPARHADRLIKWFIWVVVIAVGVNLLSSLVGAQQWVWLPPAVFVAALLVAVPSTGLLRRERYRSARARAMALLALTGYVAVTVWGSMTGWPLAVMILSVVCLWEAGVMLTWSTLRSRADLDHVAVGTACLLVGSAFLLLGVANPPDAWTLGMAAGLVVRAAALLLGVAFLLDRRVVAGVPFLLGAVAGPLSGIAALLAGWTLPGVAFLLFGVALLLCGLAGLLAGWTLPGVALLLFGVAALLGSVAAFLAGWTLVGVAFLLVGVAALLAGVALLYRPELPRRLVAWLTKRDDLQLRPNGDEGRERPS